MKFMVSFLVTCGAVVFCMAEIIDVEGYGKVKGTTGLSHHKNRVYYAFYRLYYAKAPVGERRFLPAEPVGELDQNGAEAWDATFPGPVCPQGGMYYKSTVKPSHLNVGSAYQGDEDCLLLNVFTPQLPTNDSNPNLPVLFFIHGGAFSAGGAVPFTPHKFMDEDVVLVVIQYRLGALGFLNLQTDEVPGNAGLLDQVEALKWVRNHIDDFGGNPDRITIFGESAGGASVSLLMLSPLANGLFVGAIAQSGSAIAYWAVDRDPVIHGQNLTDYAGCWFPENYNETIECLRNAPPDVITGAYSHYYADDKLQGGPGLCGSYPVIQAAGAVKFLDKDPVEVLQNGEYNTKIPAIFGANKDEGSYILGLRYVTYLEPRGLVNDTYYLQNDLVPVVLNALGVRDPTTILSDTLAEKYLAGEDTSNFTSMTPGLTDLMGVLYFKAAGVRNAELHATHYPKSYWYSFDFQGRYSNFNYMFDGEIPPVPHGVTHSDELQYLFQSLGVYNQTENELSQRMLKLWTNFATYGDPTPEGADWLGVPQWEPYSTLNPKYMSMDSEFTLRDNYEDTYTVAADGSRAGRATATKQRSKHH